MCVLKKVFLTVAHSVFYAAECVWIRVGLFAYMWVCFEFQLLSSSVENLTFSVIVACSTLSAYWKICTKTKCIIMVYTCVWVSVPSAVTFRIYCSTLFRIKNHLTENEEKTVAGHCGGEVLVGCYWVCRMKGRASCVLYHTWYFCCYRCTEKTRFSF